MGFSKTRDVVVRRVFERRMGSSRSGQLVTVAVVRAPVATGAGGQGSLLELVLSFAVLIEKIIFQSFR